MSSLVSSMQHCDEQFSGTEGSNGTRVRPCGTPELTGSLVDRLSCIYSENEVK